MTIYTIHIRCEQYILKFDRSYIKIRQKIVYIAFVNIRNFENISNYYVYEGHRRLLK